jgi:uncharacterized protein (TIGR01777 family)
MKHKVLITGGTGLIGQEITSLLLANNYDVSFLSRTPRQSNIKSFQWNPEKGEIDQRAIDYADIIIHLAGENISSKRWSAKQKKRIINSRTQSTQILEKAIIASTKKPIAFISASATGYYGGKTSEKIYTEDDKAGSDFLAETVERWESNVKKIAKIGIPTAILRLGLVMSHKGGALPKMLPPIKMGVGSAIGTGKQWMPWISIEDLARMFHFVIEKKLISEKPVKPLIYNAVGIEHINNYQFTKRIAKAIKRPFFFPNIPSFILKIMFGEMSVIVLNGSRISSDKIIKEGFVFNDTKIEDLFI